MTDISIAAIIVSGGYSSRMGSFKPFLNFGDKTAIETLIGTYKSAGIKDIIVVAGYKGDEVAEKIQDSGAICVQNENYAGGMFTSVVKGIKALDLSVSAFFMNPVDIPLVKSTTIETLRNKYPECGKGIIYPEFRGKVGHPPLVDCKYREAILNSDGEGGLKRVLKEYSYDSICVPVIDRAVLMDMDTEKDYEMLLEYFTAAAPDLEECYSILDIYGVPESIVRHCRKVMEVSLEILYYLGNAGFNLDERALKAAAILHDMAKSEKNHARAGQELLQRMGYPQVGSIIGSHTDIEVGEKGGITESEILYLADKLVREDRRISIEERFGNSLDKFKDNPEAMRKIENRRTAAYKIVKKIEAATGREFIGG